VILPILDATEDILIKLGLGYKRMELSVMLVSHMIQKVVQHQLAKRLVQMEVHGLHTKLTILDPFHQRRVKKQCSKLDQLKLDSKFIKIS